MSDALLMHRPVPELPPDARDALGKTTEGVLFLPLKTRSAAGAVTAGAVFGLPAAGLLAGCVWLAVSWPLGIVPLVAVALLAALCFWVVVGQLLTVRTTLQRAAAQRAALRGDEGLYIAQGWLMLVRGAEDATLIPRAQVRQLVAVRVRYLRGKESFCVTYPCTVLHDGREILLRAPPLVTDATMGELVDDWGVPASSKRLDVTDRQLDRFLLF